MDAVVGAIRAAEVEGDARAAAPRRSARARCPSGRVPQRRAAPESSATLASSMPTIDDVVGRRARRSNCAQRSRHSASRSALSRCAATRREREEQSARARSPATARPRDRRAAAVVGSCMAAILTCAGAGARLRPSIARPRNNDDRETPERRAAQGHPRPVREAARRARARAQLSEEHGLHHRGRLERLGVRGPHRQGEGLHLGHRGPRDDPRYAGSGRIRGRDGARRQPALGLGDDARAQHVLGGGARPDPRGDPRATPTSRST